MGNGGTKKKKKKIAVEGNRVCSVEMSGTFCQPLFYTRKRTDWVEMANKREHLY